MAEETKRYMYWDPKEEACYIIEQLPRLSSETVERLVQIEEDFWWSLIDKNSLEGKVIHNNPDTNLPEAFDPPEPSQEDLLKSEMTELKAYLEATDYQAIKCGELGLPMAKEYPESYEKRAEARKRINEIEALFAKAT